MSPGIVSVALLTLAAGVTPRIQGGAPDGGDPAVGMVFMTGGGFCAGTLVAPNVVLTAAHCVQDPLAGFYVGAGAPTSGDLSKPPADMTRYPIAEVAAAPGYSNAGCPNASSDVALIRLAQPITEIAPVAYARTQPSPGETCLTVGFGDHMDPDQGLQYEEKRSATETVQSLAATSIQVTTNSGIAADGDSGGPLLCGSVVYGVTSCHVDGSWPDHSVETYARVDVVAAWIAGKIEAWAGSPW